MAKAKYPISREFFPFNRFAPPMSRRFVLLAQMGMKTPKFLWNSTLSQRVGPIINPDPSATPVAYRSPVEARSHAKLPPAYIEVAEFDCLHDDGVLYAQLLRNEEIEVEFHETQGTMHGFDTVFNAPTTQKMIANRIAYMKRMFE